MERLQLALDRIASALDRLEEQALAPRPAEAPATPGGGDLVARHARLRAVAIETLADLDRLLAEEEADAAARDPLALVPQDAEVDA